MNCLDIAAILDQSDFNRLSAAERRERDLHLAQCAECRAAVTAHDAMNAMAMPAMGTSLEDRCRRLVAAQSAGRARRAGGRPFIVVGLLVAGVAAATFVGMSQGAWTALKFAVAKPERTTALSLLSPGGIVPDKGSFIWRALPLLLMGKPGIRRLNRLVLAGQRVPAEVEEAMTVFLSHFKPRVGTLPLFEDHQLRRLSPSHRSELENQAEPL